MVSVPYISPVATPILWLPGCKLFIIFNNLLTLSPKFVNSFQNLIVRPMVATPFLKEIAGFLLEPGKYDLSQTCVVFPNKRARLYLTRYLGELTPDPVWAPRFQTIHELMESLSGWIYADRLTQLFELFRVYARLAGTTDTFDSFTQYAEPLLADFDEIDKYLVDAHDLFSNLEDLKAMEGRFTYLTEEQLDAIRRFWTTFEPEPTEGQKSFVSLWNLLGPLYTGFREALAEKGLAYEGMACRKVADQLSASPVGLAFACEKFLFVGFNALNKCEERLFRYLKQSGRAEFFWDYDDWYINSEIHEAGFFIRQNIKAFPQEREVNHNNLLSPGKKIQFLSVPSRTGQAGVLPMVFDLLGMPEQEHTALVLADENLLIPVMYAIPGSVKDLNITMGYPVAGSSVYTLVDTLITLDRNRRSTDGNDRYYYRDVLSMLGNTLMKSRFSADYYRVREWVATGQPLYLTASEIFAGSDRISLPGESDPACAYLLGITEELVRFTMKQEGDAVQQEILYQLYLFLTRLNDLIGEQDFSPDRETLFRFVKRMLKTLHIPFSGEPLSGLQLLGILETRTLDFDNVIILSMNEGVMPRTTGMNSFIPHGIRFGFGLPVSGHQDSIYAYYFYRLIQRATNVILVYDNSTGGLQTGERSRFLHQLDYELPLPVVKLQPAFAIERLPVPEIRIEKTGEVADALLRYTGKRSMLSPSAINEYLNCSLRFYFHHLAGLPQPEDVAEEIDARLFGNLLHKAMQIAYTRFGSEAVTAERLKELLPPGAGAETAIEQAFAEVLNGEGAGPDPKAGGFGLIVKQVIKTYVKNLIRADMASAPVSFTGLEKQVRVPVTFPVEGGSLSVDIGGIIDRLDQVAGKSRIVDYKTGIVKDSFQSVSSLFDAGDKSRNDAVFQVLVYAMVHTRLTGDARVVPSLCYVRQSHAGDFSYEIRYGEKKQMLQDYESVREEFEALLLETLNRMFGSRHPFEQTTHSQICRNCPYAVICGREG